MAQLVDATGAIIGQTLVTTTDASSGKVNVPTGQLDDGVYTYIARVLDADGNVLASTPVTMTIVTDRDGVMPSVELAANNGDFNKDGIKDWEQNNVAQLPITSVNAFNAGKNAPAASFGAIMAGARPMQHLRAVSSSTMVPNCWMSASRSCRVKPCLRVFRPSRR